MTREVELKIDAPSHLMPTQATKGSAGMDIYVRDVELTHKGFLMVYTGLRVSFPDDHVLLIYPRSGWAAKYGLSLVNGVGVIDSDYRGEITLMMSSKDASLSELFNLVQPGVRIAQMILQPIPKVKIIQTKELDTTERGSGGFGHTGTN